MRRCSAWAPRSSRDARCARHGCSRRRRATRSPADPPALSDVALSLFQALPSGLLDSSGLQEYLAAALKARGLADSFAALPRELYVVGVDLDTAEAVAFGDRRHRDVPVSRAVQASTALPGLYRPVRIGGRDYVDGGVKKTAHINLAIRRGRRPRRLHQPHRAHAQRRRRRRLRIAT